jgi:hypothetical protein
LAPVLEVLTGERNTKQRLRDFAAHAKDLVLHGLLAQPQPGVHS